ncbi:MAG TPA: NosD domain-containing protein, partial [Patescibacteria group bacterium]|nr:NosD domain-containing protein [Patescibacteria group bacterium]
ALANAPDGNTIRVQNGTYREHLTITRPVSLQGMNQHGTIIEGNQTGDIIKITAENVTVTGFTIQNSGLTIGFSGIFMSGSSGNNISFNIINTNYHGIRLQFSQNNVIKDNVITDNHYGLTISASNGEVIDHNSFSSNSITGISIVDSFNETLHNNLLVNNEYGIQLIASSNNRLTENNITLNNNYGIYLFNSNNSLFSSNELSSNKDSGIWLSQSTGNLFEHNGVHLNARFGVYLINSTANIISRNDISENEQFGLRCDYSDLNEISGNIFYKNLIRGTILFYSNNNMIVHNNFVNNTQPLASYNSTNLFDNDMEGNYWSDYNGTDENQDGIGDLPHIIDLDNQNNYPLMGRYSEPAVTYQEETYIVQLISNSSATQFEFDQAMRMLSFHVANINGTTGFCRIVIPQHLSNSPYIVLADGKDVNTTLLPKSNATHAFVYFAYNENTSLIEMFPKAFLELLQRYNALLENYTILLDKYNQLVASYDELNQTLQQAFANYTNLLSMYGALNQNYTQISSDYLDLRNEYERLKLAYEERQFERIILWGFAIAVTVALLTTSSLVVKYRRTSKKNEELAEKYRSQLEQIDLWDLARRQFEADIERRKEKIEDFEKKYGIKIRPHDNLDEAIKSLEMKKKKENENS